MFKDKISILSIDHNRDEKEKNIIDSDIAKLQDYVIGIKEFKMYTWNEKLELVKKYIDENNKRPSTHDKDAQIKILGAWISHQQNNYKKKTEIMKNEEIYNQWTEFITDLQYKAYFESNEESWIKRLEEVKKYIDENNKRPSNNDKNKDIKILGAWISNQQNNYKKKEQIMSNEEIYDQWTEFINDLQYKAYFESNEDLWIKQLEQVKKYIDENKARPSTKNKDAQIKQLGIWISTQQKNYKKKTEIMKNEEIYDQWTDFINDIQYKAYFESNEESWVKQLEQVKKYIDENNKRPSESDKNKDIKQLGKWISHQQKNYKKKEQIMKNEEIYNFWTNFINDIQYKAYFESNEESWVKQLEEVKKYIDENKARPSTINKNKQIKILGAWINNQQNNYKKKEKIIKNEEIYNFWTNFINDENYKAYFNHLPE
jgi:antitoxin component HigA of HigAB toxin-antitoxin module